MRTALLLSVVATVALASPTNPQSFSEKIAFRKAQSLQSIPAVGITDYELYKYIDQLNNCYDVDNNGLWNKTELLNYLKGSLYGLPCPRKE